MRYDQMSAFIVMDIVREAAKYPNAIHFEIGQPDLPPSDNVKAALKDIFTIEFKPQGAFYLWADVSKYTDDSYEFAKQMLHEIQVATTPGIDFGQNGTKHYLRFAYTRNIKHLQEGVNRIKQWLANK